MKAEEGLTLTLTGQKRYGHCPETEGAVDIENGFLTDFNEHD